MADSRQLIITLEIQRRPGEPHGSYRIVQTERRLFRRPKAVFERQDGASWVPEDIATWSDQPSLQGWLHGFFKGANLVFAEDGYHVGRFDLHEDGSCSLQMSEEFAKRIRDANPLGRMPN